MPSEPLSTLIDHQQSVLIVIDVQPFFLAKLEVEIRSAVVQNVGWLVGVADKLDVPVVVTAEDVGAVGDIDSAIADRLPRNTLIYNKMTFSLTAEPEIMVAMASTGRSTAILVGLETDVCVAQSALGLLQAGYRVVVVADAAASPETGHELGLERMRSAGVIVIGTKGLYYEWLRTVKGSEWFKDKYGGVIGQPAVGL